MSEDGPDVGAIEKGVHDSAAMMRTPVASDWEQMKILMKRDIQNDRKKWSLWLARTFGGPLLWMLYTVGLFFGRSPTEEEGNDYQVEGDYRIFPETAILYPILFYLAGVNETLVELAGEQLEGWGLSLKIVNESNTTDFYDFCDETMDGALPSEAVCAFIDANLSYTLFFGGDDSISPSDQYLAGAQQAMQSSLLDVNGFDSAQAYPIRAFQKVPALNIDDTSEAGVYGLIFAGIMLSLSSAITMQFIMTPLSTEKFKEVIRSFLLVGVKMSVYIQQWFFYLSANAVITAALLTGVSIGWNVFAESNGGLIFVSHFLALVQIVCVALMTTQVVEQEELTQGVPWLMLIASAATGIPLILLDGPDSIVLSILTVLSPFSGMLQYCAIYSNYDVMGFDVGVHPGQNVQESGLLGCMLAQVFGICVWCGALHWWTSPKSSRSIESNDDTHHDELSPEKFEALPPGAQRLITVRGLVHTFKSPLCQKNPPVEVLKELDMDICRGEVFSFLGINGAGKSTSIRILTGEIALQEGSVTYHFLNDAASLGNPEDLTHIRKLVGVCPQHNDSLHGDATCREMLNLFARLKGNIPQKYGQSLDEAIEAEVDRRLEEIQFTSSEDADKPIVSYSGGMKRKVCIALALLGDPEVVFLDEPTAGMDPYNRRQVWDMIIAAKKGRSIILTTHFMDEADVLGDRVGIVKGGKLVTCGSTLFMKHHFGAGYTLRFDSPEPVDILSLIEGAEPVQLDTPGSYKWHLKHESESSFPIALRALDHQGASNVSLEITTLEQVFLETAKDDESEPTDDDVLDENLLPDDQMKIWVKNGPVTPLSFTNKFLQVQQFMLSNAWKIKGTVFLNISMPLIYLIVGFVVLGRIGIPEEELVVPGPIPMSPFLAGTEPSQCFGLLELNGNPIQPLIPTDTPASIEEYFGGLPITCGYLADNETLQYNASHSQFALNVGLQVLANYTSLEGDGEEGVTAWIRQLPFTTTVAFRIDELLLPMTITFGFVGMAFSVLDVLLLKADNIIGLFRVTGITEWSTYLGVMWYKCTTSFMPFFALTIILGLATKSLLMGNGGRWLGTILLMLGYALSSTPIGLILAKKYIKDHKSASNWFPGVYMTLVSLPYTAWNLALQLAPEAQDTLLIIGDFLCIIPPVAFQRGLGAIIRVSTEANDDDLSWSDVWSWESRLWFTLLMMLLVGTVEWVYLWKLTTDRPSTTALRSDEEKYGLPVDVSSKPQVNEERERSLADDSGINARDLVKLFRIKPSSDSKSQKPILKAAVKGVSFGVRENEIFACLGPNGSGKSVTMGMLAAEYTADHGEVALSEKKLTLQDHNVGHLFKDGNISFCPQSDALFPKKTTMEHLRFYAQVRGLDWKAQSTMDHIDAIVRLLGLQKHKEKMSTELSGGYKRRLCLGVAMIGFPKCMMVDECTTGMDAHARRLVWRVLKPDFRNGYDLPAILLSTHYMDEAAELGTRIGILIDGEIVTVGSLPSLKATYCNSYFVEIALLPNAPEDSQDRVLDTFEQKGLTSKIYEALPYQFKLQVPFQDGSHLAQLATIFELLEKHQERLHIKFYSVAQMNLEQIFIDLSRQQFAAEESMRNL